MGFNDPWTDSDSTAERAPSDRADHPSKLSGSTCKHGQACGKPFRICWRLRRLHTRVDVKGVMSSFDTTSKPT
jgi:hypothetical protein